MAGDASTERGDCWVTVGESAVGFETELAKESLLKLRGLSGVELLLRLGHMSWLRGVLM